MASDVAKKLNAINPEYNARIMNAKTGNNGNYKIANIDRNIIQANSTVVAKNEENKEESKLNNISQNIIENIFGNHVVTLVDLNQYNLTLVLDPTNPGIGIYKNGQITMLNSADENGVKFESKEYTSAVFFKGGIDGITNTIGDYIQSYKNSKLSLEEIEEKFGIEAQNKALDEVRTMKENQTRENTFKENLKVNELDKITNTQKEDIQDKEKER